MAIKKSRQMKVYGQSGYHYKSTPAIMLKGQWLKELGFEIGDYISVSCQNGKLVITPDTERAALVEAETLFMEQETKKLHSWKEKWFLLRKSLRQRRQNFMLSLWQNESLSILIQTLSIKEGSLCSIRNNCQILMESTLISFQPMIEMLPSRVATPVIIGIYTIQAIQQMDLVSSFINTNFLIHIISTEEQTHYVRR